MAVAYPLTMPSSPVARSTRFSMQNVVGVAESPFTLKQQTHAWQGQKWIVNVELPRMARATAAEWTAFFLKLRGQYGTFYLGDWDATSPRGTATGTPVANTTGSPSVNIAGDRIFYTSGWSTGITGILLAGDYIQINTGSSSTLHMVVNDASSDGSGLTTLDIEPALRTDIANGTSITTSNPKGVFRLMNNDPGWESDAAITYGFAFAAMEVL